ncbi:Bug family tripartite tricarboxylate transporter substrate binding protein [Roseomonas sp. F4]
MTQQRHPPCQPFGAPSRRQLLGGVAALGAMPSAVLAQTAPWPNRPVNIIMPLQAGTASDIALRIMADRVSEKLGQRMVVENMTGAAGLIGAERAARATADGYTLAALNNSILTILPNVQRRRLGFDPFADFQPIAGIANIPTFLGVHKDVPATTVAELVALAKTRDLNYASGGTGSPQHLATEMFMAMAGVKMTEVGYRGAAAAATDLAAGHVQVMFIAQTLALPFQDSGNIRFLGFAGPERHPEYPQVPTVAEQGVTGYDYSSWIALFAPSGTPAPVLDRLRAESAAAMAEPEVQQKLIRAGLQPWFKTPAQLAEVMRGDDERWKAVVRTANLQM